MPPTQMVQVNTLEYNTCQIDADLMLVLFFWNHCLKSVFLQGGRSKSKSKSKSRERKGECFLCRWFKTNLTSWKARPLLLSTISKQAPVIHHFHFVSLSLSAFGRSIIDRFHFLSSPGIWSLSLYFPYRKTTFTSYNKQALVIENFY